MTTPPIPSDGVSRFVADLAEEGVFAIVEGGAIRYQVKPFSGRYAGQQVETGISVSEIHAWPTVPPHWIHLPDTVQFPATNSDVTDCGPGWRRHSRDIGSWVLDRKPILVWLAHVRGVIGQAL